MTNSKQLKQASKRTSKKQASKRTSKKNTISYTKLGDILASKLNDLAKKEGFFD